MKDINRKQIKLSAPQLAFCQAYPDEVLYGGAAGGGKSAAQVIDALFYAIEHEGSSQIIFRKTFPELERSIIRESFKFYPGKPWAKYNATKHVWTFYNGSIIEFGYLQREADVFLHQGAQYDVVRFDEGTHFSYDQVNYLRSRIRGTTPYPRSLKISTNPGNIGHMWVKNRFVDPVPPLHYFIGADGTRRIFIPAKVDDNFALAENDPDYEKRLEALGDKNLVDMLRHGKWDVLQGQFFDEFDRRIHVVEPFDVTNDKNVKLYRSIDYGLDMLACYWYAELPPSQINPHGSIVVYRELCAPDKTISDAARLITEATPANEHIICTYAPPDVLANRDRVTGRNQGDMFQAAGLTGLAKASNIRRDGWLAIKELLKIREGGRPILKIFSTCTTLIKHLPMLIHDPKRPGDVCEEPHLITHSPDSLRYYAIQWHAEHPIKEIEDREKRVEYPPDMLEDYRRSSPRDRAEIERMMGGKPKISY